MAAKQDRKSNERLRQAVWSGVAALVLWYFNIVGPVDQLVWAIQARSTEFAPSGQIVFVGSEEDLTDPEYPQRREKLAQAIRNLKQAGVERVYIDEAFDRPSRAQSDEALNSALRSFGDAYLISNLTTGLSGGLDFEQSTDAVGSGVPIVGGDRKRVMFGIVWDVPTVVEHDGKRLTNAALSLADARSPTPADVIPISYSFAYQAIPSMKLDELAGDAIGPDLAGRLAGTRVVIGNLRSITSINVPGLVEVPQAMVHIYAAETLKAGFKPVPEYVMLLGTFALLVAAVFARNPRVRHSLYVGCALAYPALVAISTTWGSRASIGAGLVLYVSYSACRLRSKWKKELLLVDEPTGLPTFAALEADKSVAETAPTIIMAKMHRFEEVRKTLLAELHSEYVLRIIERLKAASPDTKIYLGPGHLLAWYISERDPTLVKEHLEGMRALFGAPLQVGGKQVDVGITFGIDASPSSDVARRLANAVSAAERSNETYEPIVVAAIDSEEELLWNISLQARIDSALENGEIYLNYQPKVLISTGEMIGVEALLRWRDPVKGMIPPDSFIRQCEHTGRMGHVTRYVLTQACRAGNQLAANGAPVSVAVNISATMLHDRAVVAMVREVLEQTGFDPKFLILEITETYRISDFAVAADILADLTALGAKISMDDFGVGAASLEALLQLPFAEIKIDRLFISQMTQNPKALGIVRSILLLGEQLRTVVVAEGVEDSATLDLLRKGGCRVAQGYGIQRPAALEDIVLFQDRSRESKELLSL